MHACMQKLHPFMGLVKNKSEYWDVWLLVHERDFRLRVCLPLCFSGGLCAFLCMHVQYRQPTVQKSAATATLETCAVNPVTVRSAALVVLLWNLTPRVSSWMMHSSGQTSREPLPSVSYVLKSK